MALTTQLAGMTSLVMVAALVSSGCATKKFVRQQTATVAERVDQIDKKHTQALADLDQKETKDISRVDERAMSAQNKADDAARAAQQADGKATEAAQTAQSATDLANRANTKAGELTNVVQNIDRYKLATTETLLFGFDKAALTAEGKQKLDQLIQQSKGIERCVIEVQGFTDQTGSPDYNLALSRRRADAVMRYLVDSGVPLRSIHMIGLGKAQAAAGQEGVSRRERAKAMRRVVLNLYTPEVGISGSTQTADLK